MTGPCKGCKERHMHCHSECSKYKEFRAELDRQNDETWKKKQEVYRANGYKSEARERMKTRRRGR